MVCDDDVMGSHVKSFCGDDRIGLDDTVGCDENDMVSADDETMVCDDDDDVKELDDGDEKTICAVEDKMVSDDDMGRGGGSGGGEGGCDGGGVDEGDDDADDEDDEEAEDDGDDDAADKVSVGLVVSVALMPDTGAQTEMPGLSLFDAMVTNSHKMVTD